MHKQWAMHLDLIQCQKNMCKSCTQHNEDFLSTFRYALLPQNGQKSLKRDDHFFQNITVK